MKLDIQLFADGKVVINTELNTRNFENGLSKMQRTAKSAGSSVKNIVASLGIAKLFSKAFSVINSSMDGAIDRLDTLNNFPKVMSNLGISAEDAEKSIKKMSDKLAGLPTTLDQGASAVQRFTSANGDVEKSTDLFLALNNAILAGGAPTEMQATALEQLSQAYAKGKPDMMEWRSAMSAMPAQLKQVARAMGYVNADELGEALRNGTVSMDDFMDTIVKLNTEGIDGFQSFEKQARNSTGGIKTSIKVAKTQVVKGVTDIIKALNTKFEKTSFGSLSEFIKQVGEKSKEALDIVAKLISGEISAKDFGKEIVTVINKSLKKINEELPNIINKGMEFIINFGKGMIAGLPELINNVSDIIITLIDSFVEHLPEILELGMELLEKIAKGIEDNLPKLIEASEKAANSIINYFSKPETIEKMMNIGVKIVSSIGKGMLKSVPNLGSIMTLLTTKITDIGSNLGKKAGEKVGDAIGKGVVRGILGNLTPVGSASSELGIYAAESIKKTLKIHSPSRVFRDEVGKQMALGIAVGFDDEIDSVYRNMQNAINLEQSKLQSNVETGKVFNSLVNTTPVVINLDANVEMDSQKVGRLVTPTVTRTIKNGGGV